MNKKFVLVFSFLIAAGIFASCTAPAVQPTQAPAAPATTEAPVVATIEPTAEPIVITDALGRTVTFQALPQRIVIIGKALNLILNTAFLFPEAQERIISYEKRSQTGNDFLNAAYPSVSNLSLLEKDAGAEQVAPLNPDLVIMKSYLKDSVGAPIEQLGINVVYLDLETPEAFYKDLRTLGKIFGDDARAEQLVTLYEGSVKSVVDPLLTMTDAYKPTVLLLQYSSKGGEVAFSIPPASYLQTSLVEMAGGLPIWKDTPTENGWTVVSLEQIAAWNPQIVFIVDYSGKAVDVVSGLETDAKWMELDAVKSGKIYAFPSDFLSWDQPDPRWTLGLTWLATKITPDLFTSVKITEEVTRFYSDFYGLSSSVITDKVLSILKGDL